MVNFKEIYLFPRFKRGSNIFQGGGGGGGGGSNFFQRGSNCLFPIETHMTCDFPGGGGSAPCPPPLDPHLIWNTCWVYDVTYDSNSIYPLYFLLKEALWETVKAALNCRKYNTTFHQGLRTFQRKGLHFGNKQNL